MTVRWQIPCSYHQEQKGLASQLHDIEHFKIILLVCCIMHQIDANYIGLLPVVQENS